MKHILTIKIIVLFIFVLTSLNLHSQENIMGLERLMTVSDIKDNNIRKILQDKQGFLWLCKDGLLKYDGYAVTQYKHNPFDPNSLSHNNIYTLFIDQSDTMWLGTPEGLCILDRKSEKFTRFTPAVVPGMPALGNVSAICEDVTGNLWIGNFEGKLWKYNRKTGKFLLLSSKLGYLRKPDLPQDYVSIIKIYKDSKGVIWIGTTDGLHRLNANLEKFSDMSFTDFRHNPSDSLSLRSSRIADIHEDKQGVLWISTSRPAGLSRFDAATEKFINYPDDPRFSSLVDINNVRGREILEDSSGTLWIADTYTLKSLKKGSKKFDYWLHKNSFKDALTGIRISAIGLDVRGNIFVSTSKGLHSLNLNRKAFSLLQHNPNDKNSISNNGVLAITEDKSGNIWIGIQNGGLNKWNKASGAITKYQFSATDDAGLKSNNVAGITEDPEGNLWICNGQYLSCLKKGSQVFTHFNSKKTILSICRDREGLIWLGTTNGIKSFDPISRKFENDYPHKENDLNSISDYTAISIFADSKGNLWVGTGSIAFNRFDKAKKKFIHYKNNSLDTASISSNIVQTIFEDSKKNLWIGTYGGGLCQYNYSSDNFITHTRQADLPWNTVYSILEDDSGYLWLGTEKGLSCYKPATKEFINYDAKDDLQSNLFAAYSDHLRGSAFKGSDGFLYFGGEQGLNYFNPSQIQPNKHKPPVFITQFKIFDKPQREKNEAKKIVLNYKQNFFSFEFTALNYTNPQKNKYAYQLEGFDTGWIYSGSRRYASYTNLDPGEYTFKVKGSNNDGIWNEEGVSIKVIIRPPWWKTWWAYIIYGLLVIAAALALHHYQKQRVIQAEREKAHKKEMAQAKEIEKAYTELKLTQAQLIQSEKMASLGALTAGIAHEIQNPLNFVNNFSEVNSELIAEMKQEIAKANLDTVENIAADIEANEQKIIYHGKRADAIVKSMLQHSRSSSGKKEPTDISVLADEYFRLAYHGLRAKDKSFSANFETDFDSSIEKIKVVPQEIGRVILNLINNAFYAVSEKQKQNSDGYEPTVTVSTAKVNDKVEIKIKDNGNGIPQKILDKIFQPFFTTKPTGQGTGLGLSLSYDIIKAHGGEIKVLTKEGEGAGFIIHLPLNQ